LFHYLCKALSKPPRIKISSMLWCQMKLELTGQPLLPIGLCYYLVIHIAVPDSLRVCILNIISRHVSLLLKCEVHSWAKLIIACFHIKCHNGIIGKRLTSLLREKEALCQRKWIWNLNWSTHFKALWLFGRSGWISFEIMQMHTRFEVRIYKAM